MHADIQGALNQINKCWRWFEHNGKPMTKSEVVKVIQFGLKQGYKTTDQIPDHEIDKILSDQKRQA